MFDSTVFQYSVRNSCLSNRQIQYPLCVAMMLENKLIIMVPLHHYQISQVTFSQWDSFGYKYAYNNYYHLRHNWVGQCSINKHTTIYIYINIHKDINL